MRRLLDEAARRAAHDAAPRGDPASRCASRPSTSSTCTASTFHAYLPPPGVPVLATLHLPPSWYPPEALRAGPARHLAQLRSAAHSTRPARQSAALLAPIENGVPVEALAARHAKRGLRPRGRAHLPREGRPSRDRGGKARRHAAARRRRGVSATRRTGAISTRRSRRASTRGAASSVRSASRASAA